MIILDFLPDDLKRQLLDGLVNFLSNQAERIAGDKIANVINQLSSQTGYNKAFDEAMTRAVERFRDEYIAQDEDLVIAITTDGDFWKSKDVRQGLMNLINRPGSWLRAEREVVVQHFADVLPQRINRDRVDKAVASFLGCVVEELWTLPGAKEIREVYSLQFQKIGAVAARQQVALLEAQLEATNQLSHEVRSALQQLLTILEQRLLTAPPPRPPLLEVYPYHNLPQPDYTRFAGRQKELDWLRQRLAPSDRAWQVVISGIGGVGKSSLALAIAHAYRECYHQMPPEQRFGAIIWISAKEEILTISGPKKPAPSGLISHTLDDIYATIAKTLGREDITRAVPEEQDRLVQKALSVPRTLLVIDNLENIADERVRIFLRHLPVPTKCIITSREWMDVSDILKLTGLSADEAEKMIMEEATTREIKLNPETRHQLFQSTSGLPLPIKLSLARIASGETFDQVMRWLGDATGDLPAYCVKGQIDKVRQLAPNSLKLLLACSLFDRDAGVSREALGTIADLSLVDRDDGLTLLQRLSLLNRPEDERFWILPIVQGYVETELAKSDFSTAIIERWLRWLLDFARGNGFDLDLHVERTQTVSIEYLNLLSAIRWCHQVERWETLLQMAEGTWFYPYLVGLLGDLREILDAALQATEALQDELRKGRFKHRLGMLLWVQEQYDKALECLDEAEKIVFHNKDEIELGRVENERSDVLFQQGHWAEAEQAANTIMEIGERLDNAELKSIAVYRLSKFEAQKQHFDKALEWLSLGEKWSGELGWSRGLAWMLFRRGAILIHQERFTDAEPILSRSLSSAATWNERRLIARNKYGLAQVYVYTNQFQLALQMAKEAFELYDRLGMAIEMAGVEKLLAKLPQTEGDK